MYKKKQASIFMYYMQSAFLRLDCQIQLTKPLAVCKTVLRASFRNLAIVDAQLADNRFENIISSFREASLYLRFIKFRIPFGEVVLGQKFVRLVQKCFYELS